VHIAVLENRFGEHARAVRHAQHRHELRLHVGCKTRIGRGRERQRPQLAIRFDSDAVLADLDSDARFFQRIECRAHLTGVRSHQFDVAACNRCGTGIATRLDPVGHYGVGCTMQPVAPFDRQRFGADPVYAGAHRDQTATQIDNLGFARGIFDDAGALRSDSDHQRVFRGTDRHDRKAHCAAGNAPARRRHFHIAREHFDRCTECIERFQVQIDRAVADGAPTGQRHCGFAHPR